MIGILSKIFFEVWIVESKPSGSCHGMPGVLNYFPPHLQKGTMEEKRRR